MLIESFLPSLFSFMALVTIAVVALDTRGLADHRPLQQENVQRDDLLEQPVIVDGTIQEISLTNMELTVSDQGTEKKFKLDKNTKVTKDKQTATLQALARGDRVILHFADQNQRLITKIVALSAK